jgi:thiamine-phosphate pyrophosphorylase
MLPPRLIALSPGRLEARRAEDFLLDAGRAVEAGLRGILLREPALGDRVQLEILQSLCSLRGSRPGLWVGVHDRAHLAGVAQADAVHLGFRSLGPGQLRTRYAEELTLGLSTHAGDDPRAWEAADYLFHGPVHDTPSKRGMKSPIGWDGLARAVAATARPIWAIGGMRPPDLAEALAAGARGVAVLSGIFEQADVASAVRSYLDAGGEEGA